MQFEAATDMWLRCLLGGTDRRRDGVFLEVGLGAGDWSFEWATRLGMRCVAAEPAPTDALRAACLANGVELVEAAVCGREGTVLLFEGVFNGTRLNDTNSIRPDWWGVAGNSRPVPAVTLATLTRSWGGAPLLCVKVDVEGAEPEVLSGLKDLPAANRPLIVSFEYGGGGCLKDGKGGWSDEFLPGTLGCLRLLKELGYRKGLVLEKHSWSPRFFSLGEFAGRAGDLFSPDDEVGNIIVCLPGLEPLRNSAFRLRHHVVQSALALAGTAKGCLAWGQHWGIRIKCWLRKVL
jgi:FkbM family methyltransferase